MSGQQAGCVVGRDFALLPDLGTTARGPHAVGKPVSAPGRSTATARVATFEPHEKIARRTADDFPRRLIAAVPHKSIRSLPTTGPTSPRQAIRARQQPDIKDTPRGW
jgi:hypothetical protein